MTNRTRLLIHSSSKKKTGSSAEPVNSPENLPDALQRVKDNQYPNFKAGDMLTIQQAAGNKALRNLVNQRVMGPGAPVVMRHSLSRNRRGVGEEEDVIQERVIVQKTPAFGRSHHQNGKNATYLWGNGSPVAIQRNDGKTDGGVKAESPKGEGKISENTKKSPSDVKEAKTEEPAVKQAEEEYKKFVGGGPYRINPYVPDQVEDFGKFESVYDPQNRKLTADMRVKFTFPDLPMPKGETVFDEAAAAIVKSLQDNYINNFIEQVHRGWSSRHMFKNIREPQSVWGKLNPITVKVNVHPVESNQHYTLKGYFKKTGTANVSSNAPGKNNPNPSTLTLFKGDLDPLAQSFTGNPTTGSDEVDRLSWNLPKIHFANSSFDIQSKYLPDLQYVSDYLRMMNRPKFDINIVGHASKTGDEGDNVRYSGLRAKAVMDKMKAMGVKNHNLTAVGIGSKGASTSGSWRKVDFVIKVDKSFTNIQDTTVHEFGHMLGLDDEYVREDDKRLYTTQKEFMAKMLGSELYGKGSEGKLGEELTAVLPWNSASVMESGNEVRPYHYVTLWQALYDTAAKAANQPASAFTWQDWKLN